METLLLISAIAIALVALLLIGIILIQQSKGGGFGIAFGGIGETVFGAHAASHLTRVTVTLIVVFFALVFFMGIASSRGGATKSVVDELDAQIASAITAANVDAQKADSEVKK